MAFLQLKDVKTHFPVRKGFLFPKQVDVIKAVNGISLSIEKGEILGIVGESGCGKSTLSRTIMQLVKATEGKIVLEGENLTGLPPELIRVRRLDFQMIFQDPYASLNPRMTVFSTLAEAICQRKGELFKDKVELTKAVSNLMERVGLDRRFMQKYPHEFSGGQRQRIAIARALAPEPKLVIADEPVSALDVSIQSQILNLLLELRDELNLTMIFISHDLSVVRYIADNIAVMHKGEVVEYGPAEKIFENPQHDYTKKLLQAIPHLKNSSDL
jgi:oligopeptide transport system ATP-binding protein